MKNEILLLLELQNEKMSQRKSLKLENENRGERREREREREEREPKLEPWCYYIVFQPQSLQICFKSKPINKIKSNLDKIR